MSPFSWIPNLKLGVSIPSVALSNPNPSAHRSALKCQLFCSPWEESHFLRFRVTGQVTGHMGTHCLLFGMRTVNVSSCHKCRKKLVTDGTRRAFLGYFQGPRWGSWAGEDGRPAGKGREAGWAVFRAGRTRLGDGCGLVHSWLLSLSFLVYVWASCPALCPLLGLERGTA